VAQVITLVDQIRLQADTLALDHRIVGRKSGLQAASILPIDQLEASQRQLAGDEAQLISLQVSMQKLRQALADTEAQLRELPLTQANQLDDLQRQLAQARADLAYNEMRREIVIAAPEAGTVSADLAEVGQTVTPGTPMTVIAPRNAALEAHLLVPSSGIGFVRPGVMVTPRYQAYPYQKFGVYDGHVRAVSDVALSPVEMEALRVPADSNEPIYRVTVALAKQTVDALGEQQPLRGGMLVDAEVGAETRLVWEWVFEPVYSMRGATMFGAAR